MVPCCAVSALRPVLPQDAPVSIVAAAIGHFDERLGPVCAVEVDPLRIFPAHPLAPRLPVQRVQLGTTPGAAMDKLAT